MENLLKIIKELIPNLNEKDSKFAYIFLEQRDFISLKDLIDSAIYKLKQIQPRDNDLKYNIGQLEDLKVNVDMYISHLDYTPDEIFNEFEDDFIDEEDCYI